MNEIEREVVFGILIIGTGVIFAILGLGSSAGRLNGTVQLVITAIFAIIAGIYSIVSALQ